MRQILTFTTIAALALGLYVGAIAPAIAVIDDVSARLEQSTKAGRP